MTTTTTRTDKFFIVSGGYAVGWAGEFDTRREANAWLEQDHEWEERTEVAFEGYTARHTCDACKEFTTVDEMSNGAITPRWLCETCQ